MRIIITFWILAFSLNCFSQNGEIKGQIMALFNSDVLPGATLKILGTEYSTQADYEGNYALENIKAGKYDIVVELINFAKDTLQRVEIKSGISTELDIELPLDCHLKNINGICPNGNHGNNVIAIIYGLPSKRYLKKAKKGKIKLGNCVVTGCEPHWYCKTHKIEF